MNILWDSVQPVPDTDPKLAPDTDPELAPDTDPELAPDTDPEPAPDTDPEPAPDTDPEPAPDTDPEPAPDTDPEGNEFFLRGIKLERELNLTRDNFTYRVSLFKHILKALEDHYITHH